MKKVLFVVCAISILVSIGVWNSPPKYVKLPNGVEHRTLDPGEVRIQGMIPVTSDYGDWYDGCNYTASPKWNKEHGNAMGGTVWTSTCMGCIGKE